MDFFVRNSILDNFKNDANVNDKYGERFFPHPIKINKIINLHR